MPHDVALPSEHTSWFGKPKCIPSKVPLVYDPVTEPACAAACAARPDPCAPECGVAPFSLLSFMASLTGQEQMHTSAAGGLVFSPRLGRRYLN